MKSLFIVFLLLTSVCYSQKKEFFKIYNGLNYISYNDSAEIQINDVDIMNFNSEVFKSQFFSYVLTHKYRKNRTGLIQDSIYNRICQTVLLYNNSKRNIKWSKQRKMMSTALRMSNSHDRYFKAYFFNVSLVQYNGGLFYYDKTLSEPGINLVYGYKRINKKNKNKDTDFTPSKIEPKKVDVLLNELIEIIVSKIGKANFKSPYYTQTGFAISVDKKTIGTKKIPTAKVVVMIGGKLMKKLRL